MITLHLAALQWDGSEKGRPIEIRGSLVASVTTSFYWNNASGRKEHYTVLGINGREYDIWEPYEVVKAAIALDEAQERRR